MIAEPNRNPLAADAADIDGDGIPDLIDLFEIFDGSGREGVGVRLGRGDGTFAPPVDIDLGTDNHVGFALGDLDGDGRVDLAVADTTLGGVRVVLNRSAPGSPAFGPIRDESTGVNPGPIAILDLDGDGLPDLAVLNRGLSTGGSEGVVDLPGLGGGAFGPATPIDRVDGSTPAALAREDVDGDGRADLVVGYRKLGASAPAGPDGAWSLRSIALADGAYAVTVLASPPANGQTIVEVATAAQPLRIDTAGPAVARVVVGPRRGRIFVTFADPGTGLDLAGGAGRAASYRLGDARQARWDPVTGVIVIDDRTVMLRIRGGRPISPQARRALRIAAGRIAEWAGNTLGAAPPADSSRPSGSRRPTLRPGPGGDEG